MTDSNQHSEWESVLRSEATRMQAAGDGRAGLLISAADELHGLIEQYEDSERKWRIGAKATREFYENELGKLKKQLEAYERFEDEVRNVMDFMPPDTHYRGLNDALARLVDRESA